MTTLITGGSGFVGQELAKQSDNIYVTTRSPEKARARMGDLVDEFIPWSSTQQPLDLTSCPRFESVINLMGESIAEGRWTKEKKDRIRSSRVEGTRQLVQALIHSGNLPDVFVSASAIGFYGDTGEALVDETHPAGSGFLPDVCQAWEAATEPLVELGVRVVHLRIGIVLGAGGGAIEKLAPIYRFCLGGPLGNGQQWMAWIHVKDLVSMIRFAVDNQTVNGPLNATAPQPVRNAEFSKQLSQVLGRPAIIPAPKFAVRLILGEFADSLFFSQNVVPTASLNHGFQFQFSDIRTALNDVIKNPN